MTLLIAWLVFPVVLGLLSLGCGLLVQRVAAIDLPSPLLLPLGFAVISLTTLFMHLIATTELATPVVVGLAIAGCALFIPWRARRIEAWSIAAGVGVFAVFAAPVVLSGRATFAGYIKLDDIATYLAMLDRAMEHGYDVSGLAPSTYEAILSSIYVQGYPLGSLLPLGTGSMLVGEDPAWVWQPYLAFLATLLAFGLYQLVSGLIRSPILRTLVAFVGAQAALFYGFALWGGIKELATAVFVVLVIALVPATLERRQRARSVLPLAVGSVALLGVVSGGGAAWLAPPLICTLLLSFRSAGVLPTFRTSLAFVLAGAALAMPVIAATVTWLDVGVGFAEDQTGNLRGPLSRLQLFGIWLNGDFRRPPPDLDVTHVFVAVVALAAALGVALALRRRAWELPLAVATVAFSCTIYVEFFSPWIGAKALASASPVVLTAAVAGAAALFEGGRRVEAAIVAGFILTGVVWSNVLQYREAFLAPSSRLTELETIGHRFAGKGPTLLTEFEPYGARHFLRKMDAEAASELRRRFVTLRSGDVAPTGVSPNVDEIALDAVLVYRTLVLRRSPVNSRPPSNYRPIWTGHFYEVWQRSDGDNPIVEHLSLGSRLQPAAVPPCAEVLRLAGLARANGGLLAAVQRPAAIVIQPDGTVEAPTSFGRYGADPSSLLLYDSHRVEARFAAPSTGAYGVWVGGSFRSEVEAWVDRKRVGVARNELTWPSNFIHLGDFRLVAGSHTFQLLYSGPDLRPGSTGLPAFGLGPFAVAQGTADRPITYVRPSDARALCGKSLDWVEALRG
jgi:hypothetical protein